MIPSKRIRSILPNIPDITGKVLAAAIILFFCIVYAGLLTGRKTFIHDSLVWFGTFHYYLVNIQKGIFPYWDPYMLAGTYFYPNISGYGLLDPACLVAAFISWLSSLSPLTIFIYFRLYRIAVFVLGAFFLFRYISRSSIGAVISAGVLLFAIMPANLQMPMMDYCFTTPFALYFLMLFIDNIHTRKRYLYLSFLTIVTGITMNVFIPSAYLFNIVFWTALLFLLRIRSISEVARGFRDMRLLAFTGFCLILVFIMSAPPVSVRVFDASPAGELFPVARMLDRTNNEFKMFMASEAADDIFSETFTEGGGFISWGSALQLLYPDLGGGSFQIANRYLSAATFYFGIVPLILFIFGLAYVRSRYKFLALLMLSLNFVNAFNVTGNGRYNYIQKFFNFIFPPLYMIDTRINLASLIIFYACLLLSISIAFLLEKKHLHLLLKTNFSGVIVLCVSLIGVKAAITALFGTKILFTSNYDLFVTLLPGLVAMLAWGYRRGAVSSRILHISLLLMIFADLGYYNRISIQPENFDAGAPHAFLQTREAYRTFSIEESYRAKGGFEYFRLPCEQYSPFPSFGETLVETKGAFSSRASSTIFMTKRHYDLFTALSPEKQFAVSGIYYPVVRFFPAGMGIHAEDKRSLLRDIENAEPSFLGDYLFLERSERKEQPFDVGDLGAYENISWFGTDAPVSLYHEKKPFMLGIRKNLDSLLHGENHSIEVLHFSINDIRIRITNNVDGYLYYGDGWSRYWQAFDGNRELPVWIANYNSKAVFLQKGEHLVRFVFNPKHYKTALAAYYAGLLISFGLVLYFLRKPRKSTVPTIPDA